MSELGMQTPTGGFTPDGKQLSEIYIDLVQYVTVRLGGQLFGIPIHLVHDMFIPENITRVPLTKEHIAGVLNLRGRIVTAIDLKKAFLINNSEGNSNMAVGIENNGEYYGLLVDSVGEVMNLPKSDVEQNPANLDKAWASISSGVHRLENELMIILDVNKLLLIIMEQQIN